MLSDKIESYKSTGKFASVTPARYKKDYPFLKDAYVAGIEHLGRKQLNSVVAKIEQCRRQNCTLTE